MKWFLTITLIACVIVSPLIVVLLFNFHPRTDTWQHLIDYVLVDYIKNSFF